MRRHRLPVGAANHWRRMFRLSQNNRLKRGRETNSDDVTKILIDSLRSRIENLHFRFVIERFVTFRIRMRPNSRSRLDSTQTRQQLNELLRPRSRTRKETEMTNARTDRERRDEKREVVDKRYRHYRTVTSDERNNSSFPARFALGHPQSSFDWSWRSSVCLPGDEKISTKNDHVFLTYVHERSN